MNQQLVTDVNLLGSFKLDLDDFPAVKRRLSLTSGTSSTCISFIPKLRLVRKENAVTLEFRFNETRITPKGKTYFKWVTYASLTAKISYPVNREGATFNLFGFSHEISIKNVTGILPLFLRRQIFNDDELMKLFVAEVEALCVRNEFENYKNENDSHIDYLQGLAFPLMKLNQYASFSSAIEYPALRPFLRSHTLEEAFAELGITKYVKTLEMFKKLMVDKQLTPYNVVTLLIVYKKLNDDQICEFISRNQLTPSISKEKTDFLRSILNKTSPEIIMNTLVDGKLERFISQMLSAESTIAAHKKELRKNPLTLTKLTYDGLVEYVNTSHKATETEDVLKNFISVNPEFTGFHDFKSINYFGTNIVASNQSFRDKENYGIFTYQLNNYFYTLFKTNVFSSKNIIKHLVVTKKEKSGIIYHIKSTDLIPLFTLLQTEIQKYFIKVGTEPTHELLLQLLTTLTSFTKVERLKYMRFLAEGLPHRQAYAIAKQRLTYKDAEILKKIPSTWVDATLGLDSPSENDTLSL